MDSDDVAHSLKVRQSLLFCREESDGDSTIVDVLRLLVLLLEMAFNGFIVHRLINYAHLLSKNLLSMLIKG